MVLISGAFFSPFVWVLMKNDSLQARVVLLFATVIGWIIILGSFIVLSLLIIGLTHPGEGKDEMWYYFAMALLVLLISAAGFVDCARNFYIEKRDENNEDVKNLL